jgi:hypothetical protein
VCCLRPLSFLDSQPFSTAMTCSLGGSDIELPAPLIRLRTTSLPLTTMIVLTGATGGLDFEVLKHLLYPASASSLVVSSTDPAKVLKHITRAGVHVRPATLPSPTRSRPRSRTRTGSSSSRTRASRTSSKHTRPLELAALVSSTLSKPVVLRVVSPDAYVAQHEQPGGDAAGECAHVDPPLLRLLGRAPKPFEQSVRESLGAAAGGKGAIEQYAK